MPPTHYGWPSQPSTPARSGGIRVPRPALIGLALLAVGLMTGLTRSPRGLLVIVAACLLVATWDAGRGRFLRVVALLALLVLAAPAPLPEKPHRPPVKVQAGQADRLERARTFTGELHKWAASGFTTPAPWAPKKEAR
jgi:hypothetical protein